MEKRLANIPLALVIIFTAGGFPPLFFTVTEGPAFQEQAITQALVGAHFWGPARILREKKVALGLTQQEVAARTGLSQPAMFSKTALTRAYYRLP